MKEVHEGRTVFVGDIHGCAAEFERLLEKLDLTAADRLLLVGDAFTKGPEPERVWRLIQTLEPEMVMGNHELHVLRGLETIARGESPEMTAKLAAVMPFAGELLPWLREVPYVIEDPRFVLVHAGVNPEKGLEGTSEAELVAIRTWPPNDTIYGPRWHEQYAPPDDRVLVFGHDAPRGLVIKRRDNGRPYLVGLDTGCVYGRALTAWILEDDRLVQVECRSVPPGETEA